MTPQFTRNKEQLRGVTCCFHHLHPVPAFNPFTLGVFSHPAFHLLHQQSPESRRESIFDKHLPIIKSQLQPQTGAISHLKQPSVLWRLKSLGSSSVTNHSCQGRVFPGAPNPCSPLFHATLVVNDNTVKTKTKPLALPTVKGLLEGRLRPSSSETHSSNTTRQVL